MINKPLSNHKRNFKAFIFCFFLFCKPRLSSVPNHRFLVKNFMATCYEEKRDQQVNLVFLGVSFQQFFFLSTHLLLCSYCSPPLMSEALSSVHNYSLFVLIANFFINVILRQHGLYVI